MEDFLFLKTSQNVGRCVWGEQGEDIRQIDICATNICLFKLEEKKPHLNSQTSYFRLVK